MNFAVHILTKGSNLIDKTIRSVQPYTDEIIVWDTGSTDGTKEVASKLATKFFYENLQSIQDWDTKDNRLIAILNQMIKVTQNDWILRLDDDEVLPRETSEEILTLIPEVPIYSLPFLHYEDGHFIDPKCHRKDAFYVARLFKRHSDITWVKILIEKGENVSAVLAVAGSRISSRANKPKLCKKLGNPFLHLGEMRKNAHPYVFHEKGHCALPLGDYAQYIS